MIDKFDLEKLRALPIEGVAQRLGLSVTRHVALCPFHDDRHPSLHFNVSKNTYKCYVCDAHGGPIDLVMNHLHLSFVDACRWLADDSNIILSEYANTQTVEKKTYRFDASRYQRYFERPYLSPAARQFLFDERHLDPRVVRWCRITSWQDRDGHNWLQTPYYDIDGNLTGVQFRNLDYGSRLKVQGSSGDSPADSLNNFSNQFSKNFEERSDDPKVPQPRFRFPKGSKCNIYNLQILPFLKPGEPLYIAEGCSDCWSLLSAGHKAIAIPSATTLHQNETLKVFKRLGELHTCLHIFPDQDIPGEKLYLQLTLLSAQAGLTLIRHSLPQGCKDFSEFYLLNLEPEVLLTR